MAFIDNKCLNMLSRFKRKRGIKMKTLSIVVKFDKPTLRRLHERGLFSDDPQWFFNAHMVLDSKRDVVFRANMHDLEKIENFLAHEDIPYHRTVGKD